MSRVTPGTPPEPGLPDQAASQPIRDLLETLRHDLQDAVSSSDPVSQHRNQLIDMVRRLVYADLLGADADIRQSARRLMHALIARLAPLQAAAPPERPGPMVSPDVQWLIGPMIWTPDEIRRALGAWRDLGPTRPPHLVLVIQSTPECGTADDHACFVDPSSPLLAFDAPTVLIGRGDPETAVAEAIDKAVTWAARL